MEQDRAELIEAISNIIEDADGEIGIVITEYDAIRVLAERIVDALGIY